jgi:hypothetical protein
MMRDEIFFGNLMGLLKTGRWSMNAQEAIALVQLIQELDRRSKPPVHSPVEPPITEPVKAKAKAKKNEGG